MTLRGPGIAEEFKAVVEAYIERRFGPAGAERPKEMASR